jgi:hypothetical protein
MVLPNVLSGHTIQLYGSAKSPVGSILYPMFPPKVRQVISLSHGFAISRVVSFLYPMVPPKSPVGSFLYPMVPLPHLLSPSIIYIPPKNINYLANDLHPDA